MDYEHISMTLDGFIAMLGGYYNIAQLTNLGKVKAIKAMAANHLESKSASYPDVFYFEDINGNSYILNYYKTSGDHDVFIENKAVYSHKYSEMIDELASAGRLNGATRYVLEQSFLWDVEDNYYTVLEKYNLSDFIPRVDESSENVAIWCHYNFAPGFFSDKKNDFIYMGRKVCIYSCYADAKDRCDSLLHGRYNLSPGETKRPTYIITQPLD